MTRITPNPDESVRRRLRSHRQGDPETRVTELHSQRHQMETVPSRHLAEEWMWGEGMHSLVQGTMLTVFPVWTRQGIHWIGMPGSISTQSDSQSTGERDTLSSIHSSPLKHSHHHSPDQMGVENEVCSSSQPDGGAGPGRHGRDALRGCIHVNHCHPRGHPLQRERPRGGLFFSQASPVGRDAHFFPEWSGHLGHFRTP